jgi:probable HAF family extracellular repeat protein
MQQLSTITTTLVLTGFSALSLWTAPAQYASFSGLGWLSNTSYSNANAISADGSVVVGNSGDTNGSKPFRWTKETGIVGLGSNNQYGSATGVSADGSVVVGTGASPQGAFRWTKETDMVSLGGNTNATGVSADGSVIVGYFDVSGTNGIQAFLWTQANGIVSLGSLDNCGNEGCFSGATAVSADGSVVVGNSASSSTLEGFRWTQSTGMQSLSGGVPYRGRANGVTADGSVIVGVDSTRGYEAFRCPQSSGMVLLDDQNGRIYSEAKAVSADGSIIVGENFFVNRPEAFLWTQKTGMVSLKETLIGKGLDVSGWTLSSATAISGDGFTIVGNGTNPSGQSEAWMANLSPEPIPEPLTILGSMAAIAFAASFERKCSNKKPEEKDPDA